MCVCVQLQAGSDVSGQEGKWKVQSLEVCIYLSIPYGSVFLHTDYLLRVCVCVCVCRVVVQEPTCDAGCRQS